MQEKSVRSVSAVTIIALVAAIFVGSYFPQSASIRTDLTFEGIMGALGALFIFVLLVERTTEILVVIGRQETADSLKQEQDTLSKDPSKADDLAKKALELIIYQANTKRFALLVGFAVAVITCSGGVGILKAIVTISSPTPPFLRGIDIVLTSGLLAGGSDSFHQFVRAIESFFEAKKN